MLCEKILGHISDPKFAGKKIDYVEIEWHEAFKKLHKKETRDGEAIGIRMDHHILTRGLKDGDVLYADEEKVVVCKCWLVLVLVCKVCKLSNYTYKLFVDQLQCLIHNDYVCVITYIA